MADPIVVLCPGQGAQAVGMGKVWAERSKAARSVFDEADAILGDRLGAPLSQICFEGPESILNRTDVAQPALFVVGVASFRGLYETSGPPEIAGAAGLSLGEYTALHLAGSLSFQDGLELVALRGQAMQDAAQASPSGMIVLIGAQEDQAQALCAKASDDEVLVPANFNAPGQIVLSGSLGACDRALAIASEMGLRATKLAVAGAFHSPLMQPAADRLEQAVAQVAISPPCCPVLSNVTGIPHEHESSLIAKNLVGQLTKPVRWENCCGWLSSNIKGTYHEFAPGRVLAGLMRRIDRSIKVTSHDQPDN